MPTYYSEIGRREFKCEGCSFSSNDRRQVKRHIYEMRKDRNKFDKRNHR